VLSKQLIRFLIVGLASTVVNYSIFTVCFRLLQIYYLLSSSIGFLSGVLAGYIFNKKWTFEIQDTKTFYLGKYLAVYSMSLVSGLLFMHFLVGVCQLNPMISQILMICLTTVLNLLSIKFWVFKIGYA